MFSFFKKKDKQEKEPGAPKAKYSREYYCIKSVHADLILDIAGGGKFEGKSILYSPNGQDNQLFAIQQQGEYFKFRNKNGKYLTVQGNQNGAHFVLTPKSSSYAQKFIIVNDLEDPKIHYIKTHDGRAMDVANGGKSKETEIVQWDFNGNSNQKWQFTDPKHATSSSSSDLD